MGGVAQRWVVLLGSAAAAAFVFAIGMHAHLRTACFEQDTPYLPICPDPPSTAKELIPELRQRIERDPGDSRAWARLLLAETAPATDRVLDGAAVLAPNEPNVARRRAAADLRAGRLPEAVDLLIDLVRFRGSSAAAQALAAIASTRQGLAALQPHLEQSDWLARTLAEAPAAKVSPGAMLPLLNEAMKRGVLPDDTRQAYMRALKERGLWVDAWGLWLAQHKEPVALLYNGGFDQPIEQDGFDWEVAVAPRSRAGVLIDQEPAAERGMVLFLEFTGRSFTAPIVRQYVFMAPGTYRIRGEYMASKFRSENGLSWAVQCVAGDKKVLGRSKPLEDTGGVWKPLQVDFTVPPDCGPVASVQLEPAAGYEAQTGMRGQVALDNFSLTHAFAPQ